MVRYRLLLAIVAGLLCTNELAAAPKVLDLYMATTSIALFDVQGNAIPITAFGQTGDLFLADRQVFAADTSVNPPVPVGDPIGKNLVQCRVVLAPPMAGPDVLCSGSVSIDGRGILSLSSVIVDITVPIGSGIIAGGTGDFVGVAGAFEATAQPNGDQVYRVRLSVAPVGAPVL